MNSFAKYLFQAMFSWVREAVRQLSDPALIDSWLARNWLTALIPILLIGTAVDFIVWVVRWQPQLVWRSMFDRRSALLDPEERELRRFRKGFKGENAEISAVAQPLKDAPVPENVMAYAAETEKQQPEDDAYYDWQFAEPAPAAKEDQKPARHRRSDRYLRPGRRSDAPRRTPLIMADDEPIDGLPPIVSKEEAFRAPVYPLETDQEGSK